MKKHNISINLPKSRENGDTKKKNPVKAPDKINTFEDIPIDIELTKEPEKKRIIHVPKPTPQVPDTGVTNIDLFVTDFSAADVDFFSKMLEDNPVPEGINDRYNGNILIKYRDNLYDSFSEWCSRHANRCPYEPFLWALRMKDGYIGSINGSINSDALRTVCDILLRWFWDDSNPEYLKVVKNVIEKWDFYQPVHVMLFMYSKLNDFNDEEIEKRIRTHWLYRALFYKSAYYCLLEKKKSDDNIKVLLDFVCSDFVKDIYETDIQTDMYMLKNMEGYINSMNQDEYNFAKTLYEGLPFASHNAHTHFDGLFDVGSNDEELKKFISEWNKPNTEEEQLKLNSELSVLFTNMPEKLIELSSKAENRELKEKVLKLVDSEDVKTTKQFKIKAVINNSAVCSEYRDYINKKYSEEGTDLSNDNSFLFGCAYCYLGHPEILEKLTEAIFINGIGTVNGKHLFLGLRKKYRTIFDEEMKKVTKKCLGDMNTAVKLLDSCSTVFSKINKAYYPSDFDKVGEYVLSAVKAGDPNAAHQATELTKFIQAIANIDNRDKYIYWLQDIVSLEDKKFESARKKAAQNIKELYPI